jgi:uncharacterized membrane protein YcgQ (UPF0703/DUF1980 family)
MYFGLANALAYYMHLMNTDFMEHLDKFVVVFIDGKFGYSKSEEKHTEHLHLVLQKLQDHVLFAKPAKGKFWIKQVSFLSHIISEAGTTP